MATTYLVTATLTGWLKPPPPQAEWRRLAAKLSEDTSLLRRGNVVLYDEDGLELRELTPPLEEAREKSALRCDWDTLWEVTSESEVFSVDDLDWSTAELLESEGPAFDLS